MQAVAVLSKVIKTDVEGLDPHAEHATVAATVAAGVAASASAAPPPPPPKQSGSSRLRGKLARRSVY